MKVHKMSLRNKKPGEMSTGYNIEVLLDNEVLHGIQSVVVELKANEAAKVVITMIAALDTHGVVVNDVPVIYHP